MPENSIVIKATDRYSDVLKKMAETTKSFTKDVDGLEDGLSLLSKTKYSMQIDTKKLRNELNEAEKRFKKTKDEASALGLEMAQANYDNAVRNLGAVKSAVKETEQEISKLVNRSDGSLMDSLFGNASDLSKGIASSGLYKTFGSAVSGYIGTEIESAIGQPTASLLSGVVSGIASGAAAGSVLGISGTIAGGVIGAASGLLSGYSQIYESRDSAFKSYYQGLYDTVNEETAESLTSGSELAASRETDKISFTTLFGSEEKADRYLEDLVGMANSTPFLYDDLTSMSKTLATYGYDENSILPALQTIGDAGAALGMTTSDMNSVATALGRMKSSNKTTLEYLNILNDRGIGAVGMLADAYGVDQNAVYSMISKGSIAGEDAVQIIMEALIEDFSGSMEAQAKTFSGRTSTLEGLMQNIDNAMGEGYNETRLSSLEADINAYDGALGEAMSEVNRVIGENKAMLENLQDQYKREGLSALLLGEETSVYNADDAETLKTMREEYLAAQEAYASGDSEAGLIMESLMEQAEAMATSAYEASEQYQLAQDVEREQLGAIRENTSAVAALTSYYLSQEGSKGMAASSEGSSIEINTGYTKHRKVHQRAIGIDRVPYDNFPALLHEDERVLTGSEARQEKDAFRGVQIVINGMTIREDADIDRLAQELLSKLETANMRG